MPKQRMKARSDVPLVEAARNMVFAYIIEGNSTVTIDEVHVVWFCKTLLNWKALVTVVPPNGMYYEITFDGNKHEVYIDAYMKVQNRAFSYVGEGPLYDEVDLNARPEGS